MSSMDYGLFAIYKYSLAIMSSMDYGLFAI
jgi:hypothetical protein